jgi:hypothetical protein
MAVKLGTSSVTLKLGTQSVTGYLGSAIVTATVPGAPATVSVFLLNSPDEYVAVATIPSNGGSPITEYRLYLNEVLAGTPGFDGMPNQFSLVASPGDVVEVSAVNAVGEGPRSAPVTVT